MKSSNQNTTAVQEDFLVLVDELDRPWGKLEKSLVHRKGILHRAFSVFIFNSRGEMLIQQRALEKYHSGGLWTNACCSHPRWGEELFHSVERRLQEEMGMKCESHFAFSFIYKAELGNGLIEHELDHVFVGVTDELPSPDPCEVSAWRYITGEDLRNEISLHPERFTVWFKLLVERIFVHSPLALAV